MDRMIGKLLALRLDSSFYEREAITVAKDLLGKILVRCGDRPVAGLIVETEAYPGDDDVASHHHHGKITERTRIIFGPKGRAYVYCIHAKYCLGVTCGNQAYHGVAFIRAVEPVLGIESIKRGPSFVTRAFNVTKADYGADLLTGKLAICDNPSKKHHEILCTERIGIDKDAPRGKELWRFCLKNQVQQAKA